MAEDISSHDFTLLQLLATWQARLLNNGMAPNLQSSSTGFAFDFPEIASPLSKSSQDQVARTKKEIRSCARSTVAARHFRDNVIIFEETQERAGVGADVCTLYRDLLQLLEGCRPGSPTGCSGKMVF